MRIDPRRLVATNECSALVQLEPAFLDRAIEAGLVFRRRALGLEQEQPVDLLDLDPVVIDRLAGIGVFEQLPRRGFRLGVGAVGSKFHQAVILSSLSGRLATILSASSGNGRCTALA